MSSPWILIIPTVAAIVLYCLKLIAAMQEVHNARRKENPDAGTPITAAASVWKNAHEFGASVYRDRWIIGLTWFSLAAAQLTLQYPGGDPVTRQFVAMALVSFAICQILAGPSMRSTSLLMRERQEIIDVMRRHLAASKIQQAPIEAVIEQTEGLMGQMRELRAETQDLLRRLADAESRLEP